MFVRALAYILANGPMARQTTEAGVERELYPQKLEDVYELPYSTPRCTRWSSAIGGNRNE